MENYEYFRTLISKFSGKDNVIVIPRFYVELLDGDLKTAMLLNQIIYWSDKSKREDGFFYKTYAEWNDELFLSEHQIRSSAKKLESLGWIETAVKKANGNPTKHFRFNHENFNVTLLEKLNVRSLKNLGNDSLIISESLTKNTTKITTEITTENKKNINKKSDDDVNFMSQVREIVDYLNLKTNARFSSKAKKTQDLIKARFNEERTIEDFKIVIDYQYSKWINTDYAKYLRPETLFGNKFEGYLNNAIIDKNNKSQNLNPYENLY